MSYDAAPSYESYASLLIQATDQRRSEKLQGPTYRYSLGEKKAVVAVAHSVLVIIYHILAKQKPYQDLGPDYFRRRDEEQQARRFVRQLETLGYRVELAPQKEVTT